MYNYTEELKLSNPGSTIEVLARHDKKGNPIFRRIYICFAGCKKGFTEWCRPVVGLDGCHIKGPHPSQRLTAIGMDANNSMFPIAYVVIEVENKETWSWFLDFMSDDLNITNPHHWTFISDK